MQDTSALTPGMRVLIRAFDDVPEHIFEVHTIEDGYVTGMAVTGPCGCGGVGLGEGQGVDAPTSP